MNWAASQAATPPDLDDPADAKLRGAFFTPRPIAKYLSRWAIGRNRSAEVIDPSCGDGVFLLEAAQELSRLGSAPDEIARQVTGVDIHEPTLKRAGAHLAHEGLSVKLVHSDFFAVSSPGQLFDASRPFDAVVGNPPFVRYQHHIGAARRVSAEAALRQGVRLSGLASSWAAILVHASSFLKPSGRLAMVMPAELLTVGYAEPLRQWLRRRFASVKLVVFDRLQFDDALENVVLLLAEGSGGCDAFSIYGVAKANDLIAIQPFDESAVALSRSGKWTDLLLPVGSRQAYREVVDQHFQPLRVYGAPELGTVTGANPYFTFSEGVRRSYELMPKKQVLAVFPPGTRHLEGFAFTQGNWDRLRDAGENVWLLCPPVDDQSEGLRRYLDLGIKLGVPDAYKCRVRQHWYRPPVTPTPDIFFTYMSHRYPRLVENRAHVSILNSMHGIRLRSDMPGDTASALSLLTMNSVTMLGAELHGRSYGGGILKMEPSEAALLPVPNEEQLWSAWARIGNEVDQLDLLLRQGEWTRVLDRVDEVLLRDTIGLSADGLSIIRDAAEKMRARRLMRGSSRSAND